MFDMQKRKNYNPVKQCETTGADADASKTIADDEMPASKESSTNSSGIESSGISLSVSPTATIYIQHLHTFLLFFIFDLMTMSCFFFFHFIPCCFPVIILGINWRGSNLSPTGVSARHVRPVAYSNVSTCRGQTCGIRCRAVERNGKELVEVLVGEHDGRMCRTRLCTVVITSWSFLYCYSFFFDLIQILFLQQVSPPVMSGPSCPMSPPAVDKPAESTGEPLKEAAKNSSKSSSVMLRDLVSKCTQRHASGRVFDPLNCWDCAVMRCRCDHCPFMWVVKVVNEKKISLFCSLLLLFKEQDEGHYQWILFSFFQIIDRVLQSSAARASVPLR